MHPTNSLLPFRQTILPLLAAGLLLGGAASARAYTFNLGFSIGGDALVFPSASIGLILADTGGDGFEVLSNPALLQGLSSATANTAVGTNDVVFAVFGNPIVFGTPAQLGFNKGNAPYETTSYGPVIDAGDQLLLVWFQNGTSNVLDPFGAYRSDTFDNNLGATIGFVVPAEGRAADSIVDLSPGVGGSTSAAEYNMNTGIIPVPEPSAAFFLAGSVGLSILLRRRGR